MSCEASDSSFGSYVDRAVCARKVAYASAESADEAMARIRRTPRLAARDSARLHVYKCPACGLWHVGNVRSTAATSNGMPSLP